MTDKIRLSASAYAEWIETYKLPRRFPPLPLCGQPWPSAVPIEPTTMADALAHLLMQLKALYSAHALGPTSRNKEIAVLLAQAADHVTSAINYLDDAADL